MKKKKKNVSVFDGLSEEDKRKLQLKEEADAADIKKEAEARAEDNKPKDKIFGNDFNSGNIDTEKLPSIGIDPIYARSILDDCLNMDEYHEKKQLLEMTVVIFESSQWGSLPLNKKFSKELQPFIFADLFKGLDGNGYTVIDMFIAIAEFMDISYERVYEIAGLKMKERLINELEDKYRMLSKKKINRLF